MKKDKPLPQNLHISIYYCILKPATLNFPPCDITHFYPLCTPIIPFLSFHSGSFSMGSGQNQGFLQWALTLVWSQFLWNCHCQEEGTRQTSLPGCCSRIWGSLGFPQNSKLKYSTWKPGRELGGEWFWEHPGQKLFTFEFFIQPAPIWLLGFTVCLPL